MVWALALEAAPATAWLGAGGWATSCLVRGCVSSAGGCAGAPWMWRTRAAGEELADPRDRMSLSITYGLAERLRGRSM